MNNLFVKYVSLEKIQPNNYYGHFWIGPLKVGQGITIGNQLRRVLLGDLGGVAISGVKIKGISHEFSTLPGVREDILEILLNLKGIIFKSDRTDFEIGKLEIKGPKVVTADLIKLPNGLEIVNPKHYIATISTSDPLEIEFKFEYGVGYKLANRTFLESDETFLQVDRVFMPVRTVDFKIENIYDTDNNVSERLKLDIWTNGSILPHEAIKVASKIIVNLFSSLIKNPQKTVKKPKIKKLSKIVSKPYTNMAIEELHLPVRAYNCLKRAQINTVGELLKNSPQDLRKLRNFGEKSAEDVYLRLKLKLGVIFR